MAKPPAQLRIAVGLLWISLAVSTASSAFALADLNSHRAASGWIAFGFAALVNALFIHFAYRRQNWARLSLLVLITVAAAADLLSTHVWPFDAAREIWRVGADLLDFAALLMLFSRKAGEWYLSPPVVVAASDRAQTHLPAAGLATVKSVVAPQKRTVTTPLEALVVCAICFGWFIYDSTVSWLGGQVIPFSDEGHVRTMAFEAFLAILAIAGLHSRGFSVESLVPVPKATDVGVGLLLYIGATLYAVSATELFAVPGQVEPIDRMVTSARISLPTLIASSVINGAFEEVFLLGFLVRGLRGYGLTLAIGASLFVRLLYHTYQGPLGALSALIFGAVLTLYFIESEKLFPAVLAHAIADVVPFVWR